MWPQLKNIFALLAGKEKRRLVYLCLAMICTALVEMTGIASIMPFMAVVTNPGVIVTNRWLSRFYGLSGCASPQSFLILLGLLLLVLMICSNLFKAGTIWLSLRYENRLDYVLSRRLLAHYLARPYAFFLKRNTTEMGKNVLSEVNNVVRGVLSAGMQVLSSSLVSLFILLLLLLVNPLVAGSLSLLLGGGYAGIYWMVRHRLTRIGREQVAANVMKYKIATEALSGIKDLKIMGRERLLLERFAVQAQRYARNSVISGTIAQLPRYALEVMALGGVLLMVLYYLGVKGESPSQTIPFLALYVYAGYRLLPALQQIFANLTTVRYNLAALDLLCRDLHEEGGAVDGEAALQHAAAAEPLPFSRELALQDLQFSYGGSQCPAIRGVSLTLARNASIGLVGATGSGKSTLVDIILGLLLPDSGQLLVDGVKIDGKMLVSWQRNFGYVPQQIYLADDTVSRNIAFGVPDGEIDRAAVIRAARIANLHDFVEQQLPKGYDTMIGERGVRLSGGQRQRIGIARALYHDPAILVMDEATNALDGVTEEAVMEALGRLAGQKTIILIAHRLTTVKECDLIYILERGQIVSQGTYVELQQSSEWFQAASR